MCSIGGNLAENSGGAHCLKYGFTVNHVTGAELVAPDGELVKLGGKAVDPTGYDLLGAVVGSEGTLGVATKVTVRLVRLPESVRTLLAAFPSPDEAGAATSAIIGAGVIPAAIEMMDALAIEAAEAAVQCGYPEGAGAVLVIELDGPVGRGRAAVRRGGAALPGERRVRDPDRRRRRASGRCSGRAGSRRSPRSAGSARTTSSRTASSRGPRCRRSCGRSASSSAGTGVRVANVFHAGDGNLHPLVLFDDSHPGEAEQAEEVSGAILDLCIANGGSITGEHGVGSDKAKYMPRMFTDDDLDTMQMVRCAFDPKGLSNPGKVFPTPRLCGEVPGPAQGRPSAAGSRARGRLLMTGLASMTAWRRAPLGPDVEIVAAGPEDAVDGVARRLRRRARPAPTRSRAVVRAAARAATSPSWPAVPARS